MIPLTTEDSSYKELLAKVERDKAAYESLLRSTYSLLQSMHEYGILSGETIAMRKQREELVEAIDMLGILKK